MIYFGTKILHLLESLVKHDKFFTFTLMPLVSCHNWLMKNTTSLLLATLVFSSISASADTLLVSDMDDTIKVSHVLDKDSVIANVAMIHNVFMGMPELYQAITQIPEVKTVKYLSNAPKKIIGDLHEKFLTLNKFPKGDFVARGWYDLRTGNSHKVNSLRKFIKQYDPKELILIGDNGEGDAEIYAQIRTEYPNVLGPTYIRQAYSSRGFSGNFARPLHEGQIPFSSSVDIALDLFKRGYLSSEAVTDHVLTVVPNILAEDEDENRGSTAFPEWYDCRDFNIPELPLLVDLKANDLLQEYGNKVQQRCSTEPYDD